MRHYTYGGDLARGIVTCMAHPAARNEDFNISTARSTTVLELAGIIWRKMHGEDTPLRVTHDPAFEHDVARRVPSVEKAARMLDVHCTTSLEDMLDEVIPWVTTAVHNGTI